MTRHWPFARRVRYFLEGTAAAGLFAVIGALPVGVASGLGAFFGGVIGPLLPVHRLAQRNIRRALPDLPSRERERALRAMWRNLGRVGAEYAHLDKFHAYRQGGRIEVVGTEHLDSAKRSETGGIFFSGHVGNWEVAPLAVTLCDIPVALIYRAPNNPSVNQLIKQLRGVLSDFPVPKGRSGARDMIKYLRGGGHLAMLVDQKMNDGIPVPFFGRDAMTAPALAELALKYGCPVWPVRVERLKGARFRITVFPKLDIPRTENRAADVAETMRRVNEILEGWIRDRPEQWLWAHRRWPD